MANKDLHSESMPRINTSPSKHSVESKRPCDVCLKENFTSQEEYQKHIQLCHGMLKCPTQFPLSMKRLFNYLKYYYSFQSVQRATAMKIVRSFLKEVTLPMKVSNAQSATCLSCQ